MTQDSTPLPSAIHRLPESLQKTSTQAWRDLMAVEDERLQQWCPGRENDLLQAMARSDYLREQLVRHSDVLAPLLTEDVLEQPWYPGLLAGEWAELAATIRDEAQLMRLLRDFRRRCMFRLLWRDLLGWSDLQETMSVMTELAEVTIDGALDWLYADCCAQWGTPMGRAPHREQSVPQKLVVLGMGKLGAHELNVSSDIDLIFAFPDGGETEGGPRPLDNQQFFIRLGQRLIQALDKPTADGFVFRVDMRLRPYGQSGALALSFAALEAYYQDQGREWERYAMVKARVVGGDREAGQQLMAMLRPFVYRRYIDFSAFESLREMKAMISREVRRKGLETNIKLGAGGIREVEFVVQAFQLIRGGRDQELQERHLLTVLKALAERELLPATVVADLSLAYVFLRNLEHAIQGVADKQTQTLPEDQEGQDRLALILGFSHWQALCDTLDQHRQAVSRHFADIITTDEGEQQQAALDDEWQELWLGELTGEAALEWLAQAGYDDGEDALERIQKLRDSRALQSLQSKGRRRLDQFMPGLLAALADVEQPAQTLQRVMALVESVLRRSAYLVLLNENPGALGELVKLCSASPWIAQQLAQTPLLLDELLNAESLYAPPAKEELEDELRQQLLRVPLDDLEEQMECLRHYKKAHVLRVAAAELRGTLPLKKVSDYLTWVAEVVLEHVVNLAWHQMSGRYGEPTNEDGSPVPMDFAVIGYGKFGGIELGYTSDLDLVFVHDSDPQLATNGERSIDNAVFYTRLGQRIVHILNTHTPSGQLYEVDMRLRPSGNSGLLVSTLKAFEHYQRNDAWTWEHQALARTRWVAGSQNTGRGFEALRRELLCQPRDNEPLRREVAAMREKMRASLAPQNNNSFHLKQDPGGIIDIEFMVQYLILAHGHQQPRITDYSDNVRQLETLGEMGILPEEVALKLRDIYIAMRSTIHRQALQTRNSEVAADQFSQERDYVREIWQQVMGPTDAA
ncbi:MAG: bifunctional [glutamate--ammonia ligase]-adenylyl-L-tyrosine phosphorylase/[glutamate--ammonia-ligase] adenylyltransferase [Halomonadaceae bacterium]|nr:MAG: bifunctional [glutamate--ammonia ligase]-adenylyl-L-tyrosine phosphorylase/[glutamate--ammonia-ligase] adenylyltransferase [Halomonadaceae bacterium]